MTSDLQQNRYDQLVRRVGGIIGPGSKVAEALTELFPMIDVENVPAELLFLSGTHLGMGSSALAATAAEVSKIQLFNPVGSGKLVTITRIVAESNAIINIELDLRATALTTNVGNNVLRDTRTGTSTLATAQIRNESSAGGVSPFWVTSIVANTGYVIEDSNAVAVLAPGTGLVIAPDAVNLAITAAFFWRERVALESELLFT